MDGGAVDGHPVVVAHRELFGDAEGLAVADHHPDDLVVRHPARDEGVHPHPRQADLAPGALRVFEGPVGELLLVGAPAHLGGGRPLLAEALNAPGIDELVDLLRTVGDLRVAFAAVDHLHAELVGEVVEGARPSELADLLPLPAGELPLLEAAHGDVEEGLLREMADEAGIGAMLENGRRAGRAPVGDHPPQVHVAPVERQFVGLRRYRMLVRIPHFDGGVEIEHPLVMAPLHDLAAVDVPGEIDEEITCGEVLAEDLAEVVGGDPLAHEAHAPFHPGADRRFEGLEVEDRDVVGRHLDVVEEDRQGAAGHGAEADKENPVWEDEHRVSTAREGLNSPRAAARRPREWGRVYRPGGAGAAAGLALAAAGLALVFGACQRQSWQFLSEPIDTGPRARWFSPRRSGRPGRHPEGRPIAPRRGAWSARRTAL